MKKIAHKLVEALSTIRFCIRISYRSSPRHFVGSMFCRGAEVVIPFLTVYWFSKIIERLAIGLTSRSGADAFYAFVQALVVYLLIRLANEVLVDLKNYFDGLLRDEAHKYMQEMIMRKSAGLELAFFDSAAFYNEMQDANGNCFMVVNTSFQVFDFLKGSIQLVVSVAYLCMFSLLYPVVLIVAVIPKIVMHKKQLTALYDIERGNLEPVRKMHYISGIFSSRNFAKDVKMYDLFPVLVKDFGSIWKKGFEKRKGASAYYTGLLILCGILPEIASIGIFCHLGFNVFFRGFGIGDFTYYQGIVLEVIGSMNMVVYSYGSLADGKNRIDNINRFMAFENTIKDTGTVVPDKGRFEIAFDHVSFRYSEDGPEILKDVNFTYCAPQKLALVGKNGSGKTTIIKLLLRFYDPDEGTITLNGIDIKQYPIDVLRRQYSTMFQDYCHYAFTLGRSISLSDINGQGDEQAIKEALVDAGGGDLLKKLDKGLETYLTRAYDDDGCELSGGQWQKIALARTFYRKAPVYILDEPSASLDAEAEDELFGKFEDLYKNTGAIMVSHRLTNIMDVDKILVIDGGTVTEQGDHRTLMEHDGEYAYLYKLQASKYDIEP